MNVNEENKVESGIPQTNPTPFTNENKFNSHLSPNCIIQDQEENVKDENCICNCHKNQNDSNQTYGSVKIDAKTDNFAMYKGFFFMFISMLCRTGTAISEKFILHTWTDLTAYQLNAVTVYYMFGFTGIIFFLSLSGVIDIKLPNKKSIIWLIVLRSVMAIIVETMLVKALQFLPASNVYCVYFLYPIVVMILTTSLLGEKLSIIDILCAPVCILGVIFIVRPKFLFDNPNDKVNLDSNNLLYLAVGVACLAKGTADFFIRKIKTSVHFLVIPMAFSTFGLLIFPILPLVDQIPLPDLTTNLHLSILGTATLFFAYQAFLAYALQFESAGRVVMVNYLQLVFLFFADLYIFKKPYNNLDLLGVGLIFGINFGNAIYKTMKRFNEKERKQGEISKLFYLIFFK